MTIISDTQQNEFLTVYTHRFQNFRVCTPKMCTIFQEWLLQRFSSCTVRVFRRIHGFCIARKVSKKSRTMKIFLAYALCRFPRYLCPKRGFTVYMYVWEYNYVCVYIYIYIYIYIYELYEQFFLTFIHIKVNFILHSLLEGTCHVIVHLLLKVEHKS